MKGQYREDLDTALCSLDRLAWVEILLEEREQGEEEDPEHPHRVPVPRSTVYENLAVFHLAGRIEGVERGNQEAQAHEEMDRVGVGDQVEKMAALTGGEEYVLQRELMPGHRLAG